MGKILTTFFFILFVSCIFASQSQSPFLRILTTDLKSSLLDPVSGKLSETLDLTLPTIAPGCQWKFPLSGTRGQTSTVFYQNLTNFVTGQAVCEDGSIARSSVFQLYENGNARPLYTIDPTIPIDELNVNWDHACNVVVLQPQYLSNGTLITTKQVSEYDAQVRPQVDYTFNVKDCDNCWLKVNGLGGLDFGSFNSIWNPEYNCGDSCIFYTLEEQIVNGEVQPPRALIGRSFRTRTLAINVTDSINAQSISWNPQATTNQFLGIGVCCNTEKWCHPGCTEALNSHLVLFSFLPYQKGQEISVLADIGSIIDADSIRLGVEYSPIYQSGNHMAYVYYQQSVISFTLTLQNGVVTAAQKAQQSPKVETDAELVVWATAFPF